MQFMVYSEIKKRCMLFDYFNHYIYADKKFTFCIWIDLMLTILNFKQSWSPAESHPHTTRQRKHFRNWWLRVAGKESHKSLPTACMYTYIYIKTTKLFSEFLVTKWKIIKKKKEKKATLIVKR